MDFNEWMNEVWRYTSLPSTAKDQLPKSLSKGTKKLLMRMESKDAARIIEEAVEEINNGSVKSIDILIKEKEWRKRT